MLSRMSRLLDRLWRRMVARSGSVQGPDKHLWLPPLWGGCFSRSLHSRLVHRSIQSSIRLLLLVPQVGVFPQKHSSSPSLILGLACRCSSGSHRRLWRSSLHQHRRPRCIICCSPAHGLPVVDSLCSFTGSQTSAGDGLAARRQDMASVAVVINP